MHYLDKFKKLIKIYLRGDANIKLLINRGMIVGENLNIQGECKIDSSHAWLISIGNNVTIAPRCHILAHDASTKKYIGYTRIGLVTIGDNVFIGADSIILPGVQLGEGCIVGAGSVVSRDVPPKKVVAGVPARVICDVDDYIERCDRQVAPEAVFGSEYTIAKGVSCEMKSEMISILKRHGGRGLIR